MRIRSRETGFWRIAAILPGTLACGCLQPQAATRYYTSVAASVGNPDAAREANERGLSFAATGDYDSAGRAFREALQANVAYAPAHNNLGLVLLHEGRFHQSALEFSFAAKLDPRAAEPLINLGRLYESVGWHKAAVDEYESALTLAPYNVEVMGRLARMRMRCGGGINAMRDLVERLARQTDDSKWQRWATAELAREATLSAR